MQDSDTNTGTAAAEDKEPLSQVERRVYGWLLLAVGVGMICLCKVGILFLFGGIAAAGVGVRMLWGGSRVVGETIECRPPAKFSDEFINKSPEDLAVLCDDVLADFADGRTDREITEALMASGWSKSASIWIVWTLRRYGRDAAITAA